MPEVAGGPLPAVLLMLRDTLAPGGRDQRLLDHQVMLSLATKDRLYADPVPSEPGYRPVTTVSIEKLVADLTVGLRPGLATIVALTRAAFRLQGRPYDGLDRSEAEIYHSGTATAIERARLLAVTAQVAGIASRICLLYRAAGDQPPFHAVCELRVMGTWAVFDPLANQSFLVTHHPYASAWEIMRRPAVADMHPEHGRKPTLDSSFYRVIGIAPVKVEAEPQ